MNRLDLFLIILGIAIISDCIFTLWDYTKENYSVCPICKECEVVNPIIEIIYENK